MSRLLLLVAGAAEAGSLSVSPPPAQADISGLDARVVALEAIDHSATLLWSGHLDASPAFGTADTLIRFTGAGGGVPSGWAEWDPPTNLTVAETAGDVRLRQTFGSSAGWAGVYRAVPVGDATITAHVRFNCSLWDMAANAILLVAEDLAAAPTTANIMGVRGICTGSKYDEMRATAYNAASTVIDAQDLSVGTLDSIYLRICIDDTNDDLIGCISSTGASWHCGAAITFVTAAVTPVHVVLGGNTSAGVVLDWDLYREDLGAPGDCTTPIGGYDD